MQHGLGQEASQPQTKSFCGLEEDVARCRDDRGKQFDNAVHRGVGLDCEPDTALEARMPGVERDTCPGAGPSTRPASDCAKRARPYLRSWTGCDLTYESAGADRRWWGWTTTQPRARSCWRPRPSSTSPRCIRALRQESEELAAATPALRVRKERQPPRHRSTAREAPTARGSSDDLRPAPRRGARPDAQRSHSLPPSWVTASVLPLGIHSAPCCFR